MPKAGCDCTLVGLDSELTRLNRAETEWDGNRLGRSERSGCVAEAW
jgi:hypothetical protein